jgi:HrpA-like RNA helicase
MANFDINTNIGILDPNGLNINPLTNKPYENIYSHIKKTIEGETVPATYVNLAKIWKTKKVYDYRYDIINSVTENQITLIVAGTGVGKTVLIPKLALHSFGYTGKVITTIPKKIITKSTAEFASMCLDVELGNQVGYYYKGDKKISNDTKLIFTTTGSLISRLTGDDPYLNDYNCIIIDEAHERTVQTDQLLLLIKKICNVRKDLKVVIMSATIDLDTFRNYFPKTKFKFNEIDVGSELTYPVKDIWLKQDPTDWKQEASKIVLNILTKTTTGDILIFGRSGGDANVICKNIHLNITEYNKKNNTTINPFCVKLAGNSTKEEEELAKNEYAYTELLDENNKPYTRKIVVATNVAESSITVDGVVYVIDSGLEFTESYYSKSMVRSLLEEYAAQSSIIQRKGRAGRTKPGICFHLYTEKHFRTLSTFPIPNIQKSDITNDILNLMNLDYIKNISDLRKLLKEFISPPSDELVNNCLYTLKALGAINNDTNNSKLTPLGKLLSNFRSIKVNHARSLIESYLYKCENDMIDIISLIIQSDGMVENIFLNYDYNFNKTPKENKELEKNYKLIRNDFSHPYGDHFTLLNIYKTYLLKKKELNIKKEDEIVDLSNDIIEVEDDFKDLLKITKEREKTLVNQQGSGNLENKLRKWCVKNYINYKKIKYVSILSKSIKNKLFNFKTNHVKQDINFKRKIFDSYDDKLLYCLLTGNFIYSAVNTLGLIYKPLFPKEKKIGKIHSSSFLNVQSNIIIYDELFMSSKKANLLKFNIVTTIDKDMYNMLDNDIKEYIKIGKYKSAKKKKKKKQLPKKKQRKSRKLDKILL